MQRETVASRAGRPEAPRAESKAVASRRCCTVLAGAWHDVLAAIEASAAMAAELDAAAKAKVLQSAELERTFSERSRRWLAAADLAILDSIAQSHGAALSASRASDFDIADRFVRSAAAVLAFARLSDEARWWGRSLQAAAAAYVAYRRRQHDVAHHHIGEAITWVDRLVPRWRDEAGLLLARRLHLRHNAMRIDVAAGRCAAALTCGAELLVTLSDRDWVASTPAPLSETYRDAVTLTLAEAACALDAQTVLAALVAVSAGDQARDPMAVSAATLWPQVEALRLRGESVAWLRRAADFLMVAPRGQLRSSVMMHIATFGMELELPCSRDLLSVHPLLDDRVKAC